MSETPSPVLTPGEHAIVSQFASFRLYARPDEPIPVVAPYLVSHITVRACQHMIRIGVPYWHVARLLVQHSVPYVFHEFVVWYNAQEPSFSLPPDLLVNCISPYEYYRVFLSLLHQPLNVHNHAVVMLGIMRFYPRCHAWDLAPGNVGRIAELMRLFPPGLVMRMYRQLCVYDIGLVPANIVAMWFGPNLVVTSDDFAHFMAAPAAYIKALVNVVRIDVRLWRTYLCEVGVLDARLGTLPDFSVESLVEAVIVRCFMSPASIEWLNGATYFLADKNIYSDGSLQARRVEALAVVLAHPNMKRSIRRGRVAVKNYCRPRGIVTYDRFFVSVLSKCFQAFKGLEVSGGAATALVQEIVATGYRERRGLREAVTRAGLAERVVEAVVEVS